jgi:hypothetical protein
MASSNVKKVIVCGVGGGNHLDERTCQPIPPSSSRDLFFFVQPKQNAKK